MSRRRRKPTGRKRGLRYPAVRSINMMGNPSGFPQSRRAMLRYSDKITITSTAGTIGTHLFRANGIYDPDWSGVGHQPMGRDLYANLFNHYVVVGARISVKALGGQASSPQAGYVGVYLTDDTSTGYTDFTGYIEAKRGSWQALAYQRNSRSVNCKFSARNFFNVKDVKDNVDRIGAGVGADPGEAAFFAICYQDLDAGTTDLVALVTIDYIVDFSEPKDVAQS